MMLFLSSLALELACDLGFKYFMEVCVNVFIFVNVEVICMCDECVGFVSSAVRNLVGKTIYTARGAPFKVLDVTGGLIIVRLSTGKGRFFHLDHVALCYHWMKEGNEIRGVGSGSESVRGLIGEAGRLVRCSVCERNPAYIWGVLASIPGVQRYGTTLKLGASHQISQGVGFTGLADEIRWFVCENYIAPARKRGLRTVRIVSGDVHSRMGLLNRMPAVCSALRSKKLQEMCGVRLIEEIRRPGVKRDSSTNEFIFEIL